VLTARSSDYSVLGTSITPALAVAAWVSPGRNKHRGSALNVLHKLASFALGERTSRVLLVVRQCQQHDDNERDRKRRRLGIAPLTI